MGIIKVTTTDGREASVDIVKVKKMIMDNFSGLTKLHVDSGIGIVVYLVDETVQSLMERFNDDDLS